MAADKTAVEVAKNARRVDGGDVDGEDDWGVLVWYDVDKSTRNTRQASTKRRLKNIYLLSVDCEESEIKRQRESECQQRGQCFICSSINHHRKSEANRTLLSAETIGAYR